MKTEEQLRKAKSLLLEVEMVITDDIQPLNPENVQVSYLATKVAEAESYKLKTRGETFEL